MSIVVATADFEIYYEVVDELRGRGVAFTTIQPSEEIPDATRVVIAGAEDEIETDLEVAVAEPENARQAVDEAFAIMRGTQGRTIIGIDPGPRPGIAVLEGDQAVAVFHVPLADAASVVLEEVADAADPVVRIGDGARLEGSKLIGELQDVHVELVDETGTTPYLGTGVRAGGDVVAAINIARREGEVVESREVEPTAGELQIIKDRSRKQSAENRAINELLARRVASGELTIDEALSEHRNG